MRVRALCENIDCRKPFLARQSSPNRPLSRFCSRVCWLLAFPQRFWAKVLKTDTCWLWQGANKGPGKYGHLKFQDITTSAHRVAWILTYGPIPDDILVCHDCPDGDNPLCVNPAHLWLGTHADNAQDMVAKGRHKTLSGPASPMYGKRQTHCNKGHEMTPENVVWTDHGRARRCKTCYMETCRRGALRYLANHREEINEKKRAAREPFKTGPALGERHGQTTLTEAEVSEMRRRYAEGERPLTLASDYAVSLKTVWNIVTYKTWKHLPRPQPVSQLVLLH